MAEQPPNPRPQRPDLTLFWRGALTGWALAFALNTAAVLLYLWLR